MGSGTHCFAPRQSLCKGRLMGTAMQAVPYNPCLHNTVGNDLCVVPAEQGCEWEIFSANTYPVVIGTRNGTQCIDW